MNEEEALSAAQEAKREKVAVDEETARALAYFWTNGNYEGRDALLDFALGGELDAKAVLREVKQLIKDVNGGDEDSMTELRALRRYAESVR